jgi:sugar/nucleoside kinase (ribokinase family)
MYDITAIGHALVDVISTQTTNHILKQHFQDNQFSSIDITKAKLLNNLIIPELIIPGGSVSNTLASSAYLGVNTAFIGCVGEDELGTYFINNLTARGIDSFVMVDPSKTGTGISYVLVDSTGKRGMLTYHGAANNLELRQEYKEAALSSKILILEGYLWLFSKSRHVVLELARISKNSAAVIAFSLSDKVCVENHRDEFLSFIENYVDILFCNQDEITALLGRKSQKMKLDEILKSTKIIVITCGTKGSKIITPNEEIIIEPLECNVFDTTGAGDAYMGGFLYGLLKEYPLDKCGKLGNHLASKVITGLGGSPFYKSLSQKVYHSDLQSGNV